VLYTPVVQGWFEGGLRRLLSEEATPKTIGLLNGALLVTLAVHITTIANSIWGLRMCNISQSEEIRSRVSGGARGKILR
jgi:hypothetical protein